jgi:hypothetical protein
MVKTRDGRSTQPREQGCQMVYFLAKMPIWVFIFVCLGMVNVGIFSVVIPIGIFYVYLVYFMAVWYTQFVVIW